MVVTVELPVELERRLEEESSRHGLTPAEFIRTAVEEKLAALSATEQRQAQLQRNQVALALLRQWRKEDAENPDPSLVPLLEALEDRIDLEEACMALAEAKCEGTIPWEQVKAELGL